VNVRATMFILTYDFAAEPRRCLAPMLPAPASFGAGRHDCPNAQRNSTRDSGHPKYARARMIIPKRRACAAKVRRVPVAELVSLPSAVATTIDSEVIEHFGDNPDIGVRQGSAE
jgi:hypothetical protein